MVEDFQQTDLGLVRSVAWNATYDNPRRGSDPFSQDAPADKVRVIALQDVHGNVGNYGIEIDIAGHFAVTEASLIAAAINDAARSLPED